MYTSPPSPLQNIRCNTTAPTLRVWVGERHVPRWSITDPQNNGPHCTGEASVAQREAALEASASALILAEAGSSVPLEAGNPTSR